MHKIILSSFLLALVACQDAAPTPQPVSEIDFEGLEVLDVASQPELGGAIVETDEGVATIAELAARGARIYVDPSSDVLEGEGEAPASDEPQSVALAPQCWLAWQHPNQQVTRRTLVCYPPAPGEQWGMCYGTYVTYTVTVYCDTKPLCQLGPPNGISCKYILNNVPYYINRPNTPECAHTSGQCPGTGGDPSWCESTEYDPCP